MRMRVILVVLAGLLAAGTAGYLWYLGDATPRYGAVVHTGEAQVGGPFALTDQYGRIRTEKDFAGRYTLIYFGYTNCPDVCPTTLSVIADAMEKLQGDAEKVVPIFITVDPARDTPDVLKNYMSAFGSNFLGLTGKQAEIDLVAREFHVYVKAHKPVNGVYAVDHSNVIYLMGPDGNFVANFDETIGPDKLAEGIEQAID